MLLRTTRISVLFTAVITTAGFLFPAIVNAHVAVHQPNGGEVLVPGSTALIRWEIIISHSTQNWDITYSVTGQYGPWLEVVTDLPVGDPTDGSIHDYLWTVPNTISNQVRVRVVQDNAEVNYDYEDQSNSDLAIVCCFDLRGNANADPEDKTNISDVTYLTSYLFGIPNGPEPDCQQEGNVNGDPEEKINISDVTFLTSYLFGVPAGPAPPSCP